MDGAATHPVPSEPGALSDDQQPLYWSKRGNVACEMHAPDPNSEQWQADVWRRIPDESNGRHGLPYQCPRCAPDGRMHRHNHIQRFVE